MNNWLILLATFCGLMACGVQDLAEDEMQETQAQSATSPSAPTTVRGALGAACTVNTDCMAGTACLKEFKFFGSPLPITDGYCTKGCRNDRDCGVGGGCPLAAAALFVPGISQCLKQCKVQTDCRAGYGCGPSPIGGLLPGLGGPAGAGGATFCLPPILGGVPPESDASPTNDAAPAAAK